jgi:hypothetical protein
LLLNCIALSADEYVAAELAVKLYPLPDLSVHVETDDAFAGAVPVPAGSDPSNHKEHPLTDFGVKYAVEVIDILLFKLI